VPPESDPDAALLPRLFKRDERAFNELVRRHEARIVRICRRFLPNDAEAEDAAQETFVQVFKVLPTFRGDSKLGTWMVRIAMNLSRNRMKALRARGAGREDSADALRERGVLSAADETDTAARNPEEMRSALEQRAAIQQALDAIDDAYRECVILRDQEELDYDEIAVVTGLPIGTVKSRIFRGREQLRVHLARLLGKDAFEP
jgi:RNA polymerase sigma-70 factor (ECF subfamily)